MVTRSMLIPIRITINGKVAELVTARKTYKCDECGWPIVTHSDYYMTEIDGGGVHVHCIEKYRQVPSQSTLNHKKQVRSSD